MKIYQKYIIKLYLSSFLRSLLFLSSILISVQTLNIANDLAHESLVGLQDIITVSFHIIPYIIYSIAPFSVGLATIIVVNELLSTSQIVILRNAGISSLQISKTQAMVTIPIFFIMLFMAFFILPKTSQVRTEIQNAIVKSKIKNFITPESVKMLQNVTIVTSPYNSLKHIPLTFIHQETEGGEFVFVGNIQETWSNLNMLGIDANNATILYAQNGDEDLIKFQKLETQINLFATKENEVYLRHLSIVGLIREYKVNRNNEYIQEINKRIIPSFSMLLIMFSITTLLIKFHRNRAHYKIKDIALIIATVFYIMFASNNINEIFYTNKSFWVVYVNIALTFAFIYFFSKKDFFRKKYV